MPRKTESQKKAYKGELNKPIEIHPLPSPPTLFNRAGNEGAEEEYRLTVEKHLENIQVHILKERLKKINLLLEHYGISEGKSDKWFSLAIALANDNVAGFHIKIKGKRVGSPKKWCQITLAKLYFDVQKEINNRSFSVRWACSRLIKSETWKPYIRSKNKTPSIKVLENRYLDAENSVFITLFLKLKKHTELENICADYPLFIDKIFEDIH